MALLGKEFGDGFDRFDVGAEDFERGEDRNGEDDARNAPHPAPETEGQENHDRVQRERAAHDPRGYEISFQRSEEQIDRGKDKRVTEDALVTIAMHATPAAAV